MTVEFGDFFEGSDKLDRLRVHTYIKLLNHANYDGISIDSSSFGMGYDFLAEQIKTVPIPFISMNAREKITGDFLDRPFVIKDMAGFKVAIIGLTGDNPASKKEAEPDSPMHAGLSIEETQETLRESAIHHIKLEDPFRALEDLLPSIENQSDFIVLLSSLDHETNRQIAGRFSGIGVILGRHEGVNDERVDSTLITNNKAKDGKKIGDIALTIDDKGEIVEYETTWIPVLKTYADNTEARTILDNFYNAVANDETLWKTLEPRLASFDLEKDEANSYVGAAECLPCHKGICNEWKKSRHANAFNTLKEKNRYFYPDCIICHTTGAGAVSGYRIGQTQHLQGVQCEVCHGPASRHVESKGQFHLRKSPAQDLCMQCHDNDIAPDFPALFEDFLSMVNHSDVPADLRTHKEEASKPLPPKLPNIVKLRQDNPRIYGHLFYALSSGCRAKHLLLECKGTSAIEKLKYLDDLLKTDTNPNSLIAKMVDKYGEEIKSTEEQRALFRLQQQSIADALQKAVDENDKVILDLFVMSYSEHGIHAEKVLYQLEEERFKNKIGLRLHFIAKEVDRQSSGLGAVNPGATVATRRFKSKYGQKEIDEDIRQILIQRYYPGKLRDYLLLRNTSINTTDWKECASQAGIDPEEIIRKIASGEGEKLLAEHIELANSKKITSSPTLFINGRHFKGKFKK